MELEGIEPSTLSLQSSCSPTELQPHDEPTTSFQRTRARGTLRRQGGLSWRTGFQNALLLRCGSLDPFTSTSILPRNRHG